MASALALFDSGNITEIAIGGDVSMPLKGFGGVLLESAVGFGTGVAMAEIAHRHRNNWWGQNISKITAVGGKLLGLIALAAMGGEANYLTGALNTIGQAGVTAWGLNVGLAHARKKTGVTAVLVKSDAIPAGAQPVAIGALGSTPPGIGFSYDEIAQYTAAV